MTHKDFINKRYNHAYTIVADNFSNVKNEYDLNLIFAKKGKLYNMKRSYGEMSKLALIYKPKIYVMNTKTHYIIIFID